MAIQISVFIENKEGRIKKAIDTLANAGDDGFIVKESEVIVIAVPDKPNGLNSTLAILDDANINLEYIYAFVSSNPDEAIVAMKVEDTKKAIGVFEKSNAKILSEEDLEKI